MWPVKSRERGPHFVNSCFCGEAATPIAAAWTNGLAGRRSQACAASSRFKVGSFLIAFPALASANRSSYKVCRLSQNSALVPKKWARRSAVSPVIARLRACRPTWHADPEVTAPQERTGSAILTYLDGGTAYGAMFVAIVLNSLAVRGSDRNAAHPARGVLSPTGASVPYRIRFGPSARIRRAI